MEVFLTPNAPGPASARHEAEMRHRSSSWSLQGAVAHHGSGSSPERGNNDDGYADHANCEAQGNDPALDNLAPVNSAELGDLGQPVPSKEEARERYGDLEEVLCSPVGGIAAALRSVASRDPWTKWTRDPLSVSLCFSPGEAGEGEPRQTPAAGVPSLQITPPREGERDAEPTIEEDGASIPQSKYTHLLPLYQDYWQHCVTEELSRKRGVPRIFGVMTAPDPAPTSRSLRFSLWQDLPEVQESGLLDVLTAREKRLQEAMFEMIGSEASYLKSLMVTVSHFLGSRKLRETLPKMEHHILFSNLTEVQRVSERFLHSLESRLEDGYVIAQVGDLVLQHCDAFHRAYVPYITNMMYQEALISRLISVPSPHPFLPASLAWPWQLGPLRGTENREFIEVLRELESAPVCERQNLKSFLVLPFQRITRLVLILQNVLKLTPPDSGPAATLKGAIAALHQIVMECDRGVQRMKRTEELVQLDELVDFGSVKSIPLICSGRHLLREGPLRQVMVEGGSSSGPSFSCKDIYLHLFNDLLLLSQKQAGRFGVLDYSVFPGQVGVRALEAEVLVLPPESFLLRLFQNHTGSPTALILTADSSSDKEDWIMILSSQANEINAQDV